MKKIYIIFNLSHHVDDWDYSEVVEYITDSFDVANYEMNKHACFCESEMERENSRWIYHYVLRGFNVPYDSSVQGEGRVLSECKSFKDED